MSRTIDDIDKRILECLRRNSRITMKELGRQVFLTGQAVTNRVERLKELGILKQYTINIDCPVFGYKVHAIVRLQLKRGDPSALRSVLTSPNQRLIHSYQITGEHAYMLDMAFRDMDDLRRFVEQIEPLGTCEINIVIRELHDLEH